MKNFYNDNEKKYFNLLNDLKNLPKINTPENFEFNLMTRIQNKNFGDNKNPKTNFSIYKFLAPSAIVITVILLFFLLYPQKNEIQNQVIKHQSVADTQSLVSNLSNDNKVGEQLISKNEFKPKMIKKEISNQNTVQEEKSSKIQELLNQRSISVDDYLSGATVTNKAIQRSNVVKSGEEPIVDGFFVEKQTDKKTIEKYRNALDSLRKAQLKLDSLKKAQK